MVAQIGALFAVKYGDDARPFMCFFARSVFCGKSEDRRGFFCVGLVRHVAGVDLQKARNGGGPDDFVCPDPAYGCFCVPTIAIDAVFIVVGRSKSLRKLPKPSLILGGKPGYEGRWSEARPQFGRLST